jgi:outer membrane lipoprotein LolB
VNRATTLLIILLLGGCAAVPTTETGRPAAELADWQFNGRISLTRGEEGWHAGLVWQEHAGRYQLDVAGPLGQGAFQLSGDAEGVLLVDAREQRYTARDADALLVHVTGWVLPVSGLRYWVRGVPAPGSDARASRDAQGRLTRLEQDGWDINYSRYQAVDGVSWPAKLRLEREDVVVRLVIDQWQAGAPAAGIP